MQQRQQLLGTSLEYLVDVPGGDLAGRGLDGIRFTDELHGREADGGGERDAQNELLGVLFPDGNSLGLHVR